MFPSLIGAEFLFYILHGVWLMAILFLKWTWPGLLILAGVKLLSRFWK